MTTKSSLWSGWVLSAIPVFFMTMSGLMKLSHAPNVVQGFAQMGIPDGLITLIGVLELACVVVYLVPSLAVLGAVLMVGYLGGAVFVHLRAGQGPVALAPFFIGVAAMGGLWFREPRLRELLPLRRPRAK